MSSNKKCKPVNLTPEKRSEIIDLYEDGYNISQIADTMKMSRNTVRRWVRRYEEEGHINHRPRQAISRKIRGEQLEEMLKAYKEDPNTSTRELAEKFGCTMQTVRNTLHRSISKHKEDKNVEKEAMQNNYYEQLMMCKPISIDLIDVKHTINVIDGKIKLNKTGHITSDTKDDLVKDLLTLDNEHPLPHKTYDLEDMRDWCTDTMNGILMYSTEERHYVYKTKINPAKPVKVKVESSISAKCEYYLIDIYGHVESFYVYDDVKSIKCPELMLTADIRLRGYVNINSIEINVCCWYGRDKSIDSLPLPKATKSFLKGSHSCGPYPCNCCCNPQGSNKYKENELLTMISNFENSISDINLRLSSLSQNAKDNQKRKKRNESKSSVVKKIKTVEDINKEFANNNKTKSSEPISKKRVQNSTPVKQNASLADNIVVEKPKNSLLKSILMSKNKNSKPVFDSSNVVDSSFIDTALSNNNTDDKSIPSLSDEIIRNPDIQETLRSILTQFKTIKVIIYADGELGIHKSPEPNEFSPQDLETLRNKISHIKYLISILKKLREKRFPEEIKCLDTVKQPPSKLDPKFCAEETLLELTPKVANTTEASHTNDIVNNLNPSPCIYIPYIPSPVLSQEDTSKYVPRVIPIIPENCADPSIVPENFITSPLVPIGPSEIITCNNNSKSYSVYLPTNESEQQFQLVSVPGTYVTNTNNINLQNVALSGAVNTAEYSNNENKPMPVIKYPTQPASLNETSSIVKSPLCSVIKKDSEAITATVDGGTYCKVEPDETNVDYESSIISNCPMAINNNIFTLSIVKEELPIIYEPPT